MTDAADNAVPQREAERALLAASEQIALALREAGPQVEALGDALQKLSTALAAGGAEVPAEVRSQLRRAVTRLQFHDRMTQHLTHVQDYLVRSARQLGGRARATDPDRDRDGEAGWRGVHQALAERLLTETQRFHLDRSFRDKLAGAAEKPRKAAGASAPGDIDLF